ncbi:unnamed protein product [Durusdinium trenchii]|uniref:Uncharacterized protein n=1 Tax=Durusdinium trenchii TaxID=1381693 RepID=A0ABP0JYT6_9DINO
MASPSFANSFAQGNVSLQSWASGVSQFEQVAAPLASELLATLEQEHTREVVTLYEEQVQLREELRRVVDLMEQEVLPRERQLHNMFEQLNAAFHSSAENMRRQHEEFHTMASQVAQKHDNSRRQMLDPLEEAEQELARLPPKDYVASRTCAQNAEICTAETHCIAGDVDKNERALRSLSLGQGRLEAQQGRKQTGPAGDLRHTKVADVAV